MSTSIDSLYKEAEEKIKQIYLLFDKNRKTYEARQADKEDLEELKRLENKIEKSQ